MHECEAFEDVDDVFTSDRGVHGVIENQPGVFVDDRSDLEPGAVLEVIGLEINRPHVMRILSCHRRLPGGGTAAFTLPPLGHA